LDRTRTSPSGSGLDGAGSFEQRTLRTVTLRLLPFLFILYIFNVLDRTNVGIAALEMNSDLNFSSVTFGVGAGIFFLGYALFEVPSNLILARVGARRWIARIMISWGLIASAMTLVRTPTHFYILRFLLGAAEAGFFPGIIYYLSQWYPEWRRAIATSRFMIAIPLAAAIGGPLGGALLGLRGSWQLSGWQWLFLIEGLPSLALGFVALAYLQDSPETARWLSPEQRVWLSECIRAQPDGTAVNSGLPALRALAHPMLWLLTLPYFLALTVWYGYVFWAPLVVRDGLHSSNAMIGWIIGGIAVLSAAAMIVAGASSDQRGERCLHAAFGIGLAGVGFIGAAFISQPQLRVAALGLVSVGAAAFLVPFWCLPTLSFRGSTAAVAIAFVSSVGSIGGFVGPSLVGALKSASGGNRQAFIVLAASAFAASGLCAALSRSPAFAGRPPAALGR
jgi:ACS family tartrate transporter-like MFS transporter